MMLYGDLSATDLFANALFGLFSINIKFQTL